MPASERGHGAETLEFHRFQTQNSPPYGPFHSRYQFGVKTTVKGKQYGISCQCTHEPEETLWRKLEDEIFAILNKEPLT